MMGYWPRTGGARLGADGGAISGAGSHYPRHRALQEAFRELSWADGWLYPGARRTPLCLKGCLISLGSYDWSQESVDGLHHIGKRYWDMVLLQPVAECLPLHLFRRDEACRECRNVVGYLQVDGCCRCCGRRKTWASRTRHSCPRSGRCPIADEPPTGPAPGRKPFRCSRNQRHARADVSRDTTPRNIRPYEAVVPFHTRSTAGRP
jgi:hypothetical protein